VVAGHTEHEPGRGDVEANINGQGASPHKPPPSLILDTQLGTFTQLLQDELRLIERFPGASSIGKQNPCREYGPSVTP